MALPRPRLQFPVWVTVRPIDRAGTAYDELGGEPYSRLARGADVRLLAQVEESEALRRQPGQGGPRAPVSARVTFRRRDLEAAGYTVAEGDLLTKIEARKGGYTRDVRWYCTAGAPTGANPCGPTLVSSSWSTRSPARSSREGTG